MNKKFGLKKSLRASYKIAGILSIAQGITAMFFFILAIINIEIVLIVFSIIFHTFSVVLFFISLYAKKNRYATIGFLISFVNFCLLFASTILVWITIWTAI